MLLHSGDVVAVDFGVPVGSEPGFARPAVVMTADAFLRHAPTTVFVVPVTSTRRAFPSHVPIEPDVATGLDAPSTALVEQMRAVATGRHRGHRERRAIRAIPTARSPGDARRHAVTLDLEARISGRAGNDE